MDLDHRRGGNLIRSNQLLSGPAASGGSLVTTTTTAETTATTTKSRSLRGSRFLSGLATLGKKVFELTNLRGTG